MRHRGGGGRKTAVGGRGGGLDTRSATTSELHDDWVCRHAWGTDKKYRGNAARTRLFGQPEKSESKSIELYAVRLPSSPRD